MYETLPLNYDFLFITITKYTSIKTAASRLFVRDHPDVQLRVVLLMQKLTIIPGLTII